MLGRKTTERRGLISISSPICGLRPRRSRYGYKHQKQREAWAPAIASGRVACFRCKLPIAPTELWDLDHTGVNWSTAPSHQYCNRAHGADRGRELAAARGEIGVRIWSRQWLSPAEMAELDSSSPAG